MCVASILEAGGPKGSTDSKAGHEFTTPGTYTCLETELTPFFYATRARLEGPREKPFTWNDQWSWPPVQFLFRGAETRAGAEQVKLKTNGSDMQRIYRQDDHVLWFELQVWIGVTMTEGGHKTNEYMVCPFIDGSRRSTRLIKKQHMKLELTPGDNYDAAYATLEGVQARAAASASN